MYTLLLVKGSSFLWSGMAWSSRRKTSINSWMRFELFFVLYRRKFLTFVGLYSVFHLRSGKLALPISATFLFALRQAFGVLCSVIYSSIKLSTVSYWALLGSSPEDDNWWLLVRHVFWQPPGWVRSLPHLVQLGLLSPSSARLDSLRAKLSRHVAQFPHVSGTGSASSVLLVNLWDGLCELRHTLVECEHGNRPMRWSTGLVGCLFVAIGLFLRPGWKCRRLHISWTAGAGGKERRTPQRARRGGHLYIVDTAVHCCCCWLWVDLLLARFRVCSASWSNV